MRRPLTASALLALALLAATAAGQPPKPDPTLKVEKKANPTDAAIAAALTNDPDVRMAKAKIQLAEAELAKARLAATQKVLAAQATLEDARAAVLGAQTEADGTLRMMRAEKVPNETMHPTYRLALAKLEVAQSRLARAEAELRLLTGVAIAATDPAADKARLWVGLDDALANAEDAKKVARLLDYHRAVLLQERAAVKGPVPDRIRAALDKPVKLGAKGEKVTFSQALDIFKKDAGLDVPVRGELLLGRPRLNEKGQPLLAPDGRPIIIHSQIVSEGETLPVGAWFQLFQDESAGTFYVREYGLLFSTRQTAPPDAPTLTEFWKQKPPAKDVKPDPISEPKPK